MKELQPSTSPLHRLAMTGIITKLQPYLKPALLIAERAFFIVTPDHTRTHLIISSFLLYFKVSYLLFSYWSVSNKVNKYDIGQGFWTGWISRYENVWQATPFTEAKTLFNWWRWFRLRLRLESIDFYCISAWTHSAYRQWSVYEEIDHAAWLIFIHTAATLAMNK